MTWRITCCCSSRDTRARRARSRIVAAGAALRVVDDTGEVRDLEARRHVKAGGTRAQHLISLNPRLAEIELPRAGARRRGRTAEPTGRRPECEDDHESRGCCSHAATRCDVSVSVSSTRAGILLERWTRPHRSRDYVCSCAARARDGSRRPAQGTGFWITLGSIFSTLVLSSGLPLDSKITFPRSL